MKKKYISHFIILCIACSFYSYGMQGVSDQADQRQQRPVSISRYQTPDEVLGEMQRRHMQSLAPAEFKTLQEKARKMLEAEAKEAKERAEATARRILSH